MAELDESEVAELLADCYDDPGLFHQAILGRAPLAAYQERICRSVVENRVTLVPAAHAVGKSYLGASLVLWWIYARGPNSKVLTTSPSFTQLTGVLWANIKAAHKGSLFPLGGTLTQGRGSPQLVQMGPDWFASGYSALSSATYSGYHGNVLVVCDESSDIRQEIWDAIESLGYLRMLCLGNPLRSSGHWVDLAGKAGKAGINLIHVSAFDSPHAELSQEQVIEQGLPPGLTTKTWISGVREVYGEESLYWTTRVLARFPQEDTEALIPRAWVDAMASPVNVGVARERSTVAKTARWMGVDPSGGVGADSSAIVVRDEDLLLELWASPHHGVLPEAKSRLEPVVVELCKKWQVAGDHVVYDQGGLGSNLGGTLEAYGVKGALGYRGGASGGQRFSNFRSACAFAVKARLDPNMPSWSPFGVNPTKHWPKLREELVALRTRLEVGDHDRPKEALITKAELMQVLKRSPDYCDALLMAFSRR